MPIEYMTPFDHPDAFTVHDRTESPLTGLMPLEEMSNPATHRVNAQSKTIGERTRPPEAISHINATVPCVLRAQPKTALRDLMNESQR